MIIGLLLSVALLAFAGVGVQARVGLERLEVDLWPEYDRNAVLVIYRVTIAPGVELPARLALRIPAEAGSPNAVAERRADGRLVTVEYERVVEGKWALIEVTVSQPGLRIEYYDRGIEREGPIRRLWYTWPGDYAVASVGVSVQQPAGARDLVVVPEASNIDAGSDGLLYHNLGLPRTAAGETFEIFVEYTKESDELTVEALSRSSPAVASAGGTTRAGPTVRWVLLAGTAVVAFVASGLVAWRLRGRGKIVGQRARPTGGVTARGGDANFCTQCGAKAGAGDRYCHACGRQLR